jgi:membrane-associated phospholipid phosphatase
LGVPASRARPVPRFLLWSGLCLVLLVLAFLMDSSVDKLLRLQPSTRLSEFVGFASRAGEGWVVAVAGLAGSLWLLMRQRYRASQLVLQVATTSLLTGAAATILRSLLGRTRPSTHELQGFYGVWHDSQWIIGKYEFGAFPSGHAATVIGLAAAAWLIDRRLGVLAAVYAALVTWSRIALGCHHFSDTVAAAILGIYGAHLIFEPLGVRLRSAGHFLQNSWLARKRPFRSLTHQG